MAIHDHEQRRHRDGDSDGNLPELTEEDMLRIGMRCVRINAHKYARKLRGVPAVDVDDLVQWGSIGLVEAMRTYDDERTKFGTHCEHKIRWAMLDGLRTMIGDDRTKYRPPHPGAVLNIDDLPAKLLQHPPSQFDLAADRERASRMREIVRCMPRKLAVPLYLYFWREMNEKEISAVIGTCESRVSQLMREALRMAGKRWVNATRMTHDAA